MGHLTDTELGVPELERWLKTQHHLPQKIEKVLLRRFIYSCYCDLEKTKKLIDLNYTLRNTYSHIFLQRDPLDEGSKTVMKCTDMLILPGYTPQGHKVLFYRLSPDNVDVTEFNFTDAIKVFFMLADARFATTEPYGGMNGGEIPIFDMKGFTFRHLTKIVISSLKIYMKFTQEAQPIRLKQIHVINCSSFLDKILYIVKPFVKSEVFKLIKFHLPDSDTLYQSVPQELLPQEYGGKAGSVAEIKKQCIDILIKQRNYLMDQSNWKIDESKRPSKQKYAPSNEFSSGLVDDNFKSLSID